MTGPDGEGAGRLRKAILPLAFGANALYEPALLHLAHFDQQAYGGNRDGQQRTDEARNWQEHKLEGAAFDSLRSGRKPGLANGAAVAVSLCL